MGFQKPHTVNGITYPESYWKIVQRNFNDGNKTGQITFNGYGTKAARDESVNNVIAQKSFVITPEKYDEFFERNASKQNCYIYAMTVLEGDPPEPQTITEKVMQSRTNEAGETEEVEVEVQKEITPPDTRTSFFSDAIDI